MQRLTLTIPGELTDLNTYIQAERTHRQKAAKIKRAETELVEWYCRSQLKGQTVDRPASVSITWYTKDLRKDPDNVAFAKKFILDGMVKAGVIPQDSRKWIGSLYDTYGVDKENPRVEITLEEVL